MRENRRESSGSVVVDVDFPCVVWSRRGSGGRAGLAIAREADRQSDGLSHQILVLLYFFFSCRRYR